jgi:aminoglycoside phosphotransferase (APT) family kinase protein
MAEQQDLEANLERFVRATLAPKALKIDNLHRTSYGFSCENWPFDLEWEAEDGKRHQEKLILRRDPHATILQSDRDTEFKVLKALESDDGIRAPRAIWLDATGEFFKRPSLVMAWCDGDCEPFVLSPDKSSLPEDDRSALARNLMDALVSIHKFDWSRAGLDRLLPAPKPNTTEAATFALDHWEQEYRKVAEVGFPEFEFVLAWLRAHRPLSTHTVLVHADFKPGNTLISGTDVVAVLDWETAHLGDPMEDLGWITNPMRASEHQIPRLWEVKQMLSYYETAMGRNVDRRSIAWWRVFANFKLLTIYLTGIAAFLDGRADRAMGSPMFHLRFMLDGIKMPGGERVSEPC